MGKRTDVDMFEYFSDISRHAMAGREDNEIQDFLHPECLDGVIGEVDEYDEDEYADEDGDDDGFGDDAEDDDDLNCHGYDDEDDEC